MASPVVITYKTLTLLLTPFVLLGFWLRSLSQPEYRQRLRERLGFIGFRNTQKTIIIHGASVGEMSALKPFIEQVYADLSGYKIVLTCFTPSGSAFIRKTFGEHVEHCYLPWDSPFAAKRFLARVNPAAMVIMETELWPNLIEQANQSGVRLLLVNGRLSKTSVRRYSKLKGLISPALAAFDMVLTQSDDNRESFVALGASAESTQQNGNLKFDLTAPASVVEHASVIKARLGQRLVWVVGSTHEDEEELIAESYLALKRKHPSLLLIVAPRHKERFKPFGELLMAHGLSFVARSKGEQPNAANDVWLIDTLGELLLFYGVADVCTVAGSFGRTGGHNPLEPGLFARATTLGPNMVNAKQLTAELLAAQAVFQHAQSEQACLVSDIDKLLSNANARDQMGQNSESFIAQNRGATQRSFQALQRLLASEA